MAAAIVEDFEPTVREALCVKAEENMRKLERISLGPSPGYHARTYPINMEKADTVAAALQYHSVWSFSL